MDKRSIITLARRMVLAAPLVFSCAVEPDEAAEATSERTGAILSGFISNPWAPGAPPSFAGSVVKVGGCTGTVIRPDWVLTAKHCGIRVGWTAISKRPSGDISRTIDAVVPNPDPARDTTMLHLSSQFPEFLQVSVYTGTAASIIGKNLNCYGYGAKAIGNACTTDAQCGAGEWCGWNVCLTSSPELRTGTFTAEANNYDYFATPRNGNGQVMLPGDSGGPCEIGGAIAGVFSHGNPWVSNHASVPASREFIYGPSRVSYTPGDFNGDGKTDLIVTDPSGSYWYYSTGTGTWSEGYRRTDLPLEAVQFTPGDFNGDGKTDVIITTTGGSYWYFSTGTGTFNTTAYTRTDLTLNYVGYTTGDFDWDGRTDLIITTNDGSYWYYSTGTGTWNQAYARTDLPLTRARFVPGDFNGDHLTDVIITTWDGSYWYFSTGTGTFNTTAYTRTDLPMGTAAFTPGDFNGDGKTDLIIATADASRWYYSTGTGTWNQAYTRTGWGLGSVNYTPGDFNGDGKTDLIISGFGTEWYFSTGTGTWTVGYSRSDLFRYSVAYTVGDFNNDGKKDMVISNASGSYWYYSTGLGTWNEAYTRTDLPM